MANQNEPISNPKLQVPQEVDFTKSIMMVEPVRVVTNYSQPVAGSSFTCSTSDRIIFRLSDPLGILTGQHTYLQYHGELTGTASEKPRLNFKGSSIFSRMVIREIGGNIIDDVNEFGLIDEFLTAISVSDEYVKSIGRIDETIYHNYYWYDKYQKTDYCLHLNVSIFGNRKKFPICLLRNGLEVEFTLNNRFTDFCHGTTTEFTLTNVKLVTEIEKHPEALINGYKNKIMQGSPIPYGFQMIKVYNDALGTVEDCNNVIVQSSAGLKSVYTIALPSSGNETNWRNSNWRTMGISKYQYRLGNKNYPEFFVEKSTNDTSYAAFYTRFRRSINRLGDISNGSIINADSYIVDRKDPTMITPTAISGRTTANMSFTIPITPFVKVGGSVKVTGLTGTDAGNLNGNRYFITAKTDTTITINNGSNVATVDADANLNVDDDTRLEYIDVDGSLLPLGKFIIGESLENESISHTEFNDKMDLSNRGDLRLIAKYGTESKQIYHFLLYHNVVIFGPDGVRTLIN